MAAGDEVVVSPANVYAAPEGTAFPATPAVAPAAAWLLIGALGNKNYTEDGVIIRAPKAAEMIRAAGTTLVRKVAITETSFEIEFDVMDMTAAQMLLAFGADPTSLVDTPAAAGVAGFVTFSMPTSPIPIKRAILVRAMSPYGAEFFQDIQIQAAMQNGNIEGPLTKGAAFAAKHIWTAIEPASGEAVTFVQQDAAAI